MRITYRVFLVGGIPITIAAAIALAALVLLNEADRARSGAVLAGTIYRKLLAARSAREDFLESTRGDRTRHYELFLSYAEQARFDLQRLAAVVRDPQHARATREASESLSITATACAHSSTSPSATTAWSRRCPIAPTRSST